MYYTNGNRCCGCSTCGCQKTRNTCGNRNGTQTTNYFKPNTTSIAPCVTYVVTERDCTNCGVTMTICATPCCATICQVLTYTITITNSSAQELGCPILNVVLADSLCYMCGTLTIDGETNENATCLNNITLDPIPANSTRTITFQARVMTGTRYVNTYAFIDYTACCCLDNTCFRTTSNVSQVQVCQCCCGSPTPSV